MVESWPLEYIAPIAASAFAIAVLAAIFRHLTPEVLTIDYTACQGGWHEAYLRGCEQGLSKIPQQPVNTYTNLAYLMVGAYAFFDLESPAAFGFLVTMTYLCIGSALYHGTSTRWAGMVDVTGIYAVFSGLATYALTAVLGLNEVLTVVVVLVVAGLATYFLSQRFRHDMHLKIGIFLGITLLLIAVRMYLLHDWSRWLLLAGSLLLFGLGFLVWNLDRSKTFPVQGWGHGLWHVFTAVASGLLFYAIALQHPADASQILAAVQ